MLDIRREQPRTEPWWRVLAATLNLATDGHNMEQPRTQPLRMVLAAILVLMGITWE